MTPPSASPALAPAPNETLLEVAGLRKRFGGVEAVKDFSGTVQRGRIVGLIGPNGSGKTTTFSLICGTTRPDGGKVSFRGEDVTGKPPHQLARRGLVRTFQLTRVFPNMTVHENLGVARGTRRQMRHDWTWELVELVGLTGYLREFAGNLSFGQQKLLELVRAALLEPALLLLDEPFAGVNETMERKLVELIRHLLDHKGASFFLIDHEMRLVMELCQYIYVMDSGSVLVEGTPAEVRGDPATLEAYFGKGYISGSRGA